MMAFSSMARRASAWHATSVRSLGDVQWRDMTKAAAASDASHKTGGGTRKAAASASSTKAPCPSAADARQSIVITPRSENYSAWYNDLVVAADLVDASPVRGCLVIRPWGMGIWDLLRKELDQRIADTGAQNAYFPLLIPKSFLAKEAEHVDGFAKECAVVTHTRLCVSGDGQDLVPDPTAMLEEPLVVRPTSETVIWHMFGKWIQSYRDLPLKINQWANVVRWELRTRPFLRTSEFLWQEGHTAHATKDCALRTAHESLDLYASVCEDVLALPVVKGTKSPSETFAGAVHTFTIEALMQNGWALQSGTAHFLGQNFAKAFGVTQQTESGAREHVWATSWGVSTRLVGALIMTHGDDKGLVLPPAVAPLQVVLIPINADKSPEVMETVDRLHRALKMQQVRVKVDDRDYMRPGAKYFDWERKGVPLRLDVGPRDAASQVVAMTLRHSGAKSLVATGDAEEAARHVQETLSRVQQDLLEEAKRRLHSRTLPVSSYEQMKELMLSADTAQHGLYLAPWCCDAVHEAAVKEETKATIRCYPFEHNQHAPAQGTLCFYSGRQATHMALFARAY